MSGSNKASLRIDWFDGTLIEDVRPNTSTSSEFADEDQPEPKKPDKPQYTEKKPIGFKRLLDISLLKPPILNVEVSHRPGFWNLLDEQELKGDFIVLIVKILASVYKCLEPGENSKVVKMLRTRFQNSNFLPNLKSYLDELPSVRISEKRLNSHLWDDAESFFVNVVDLCQGIIKFEGANFEFMKDILDLIEITEVSAIGVREEHTERFSDDLFVKIEALKLETMALLKNQGGDSIPSNLETQNKDKHYFKNLSIFPTKDDLLSPNPVPIYPSIVNGAYSSVEYYLDTQFKLLREDCFGPLREGICKYMENPSKRRHENIRVYPKVRIIRNFVCNNKVGHLVDIAYSDRVNHLSIDSKKYSHNRQLMFGSLLLFTNNNFEKIICATVLDSSYSLINEGYIVVSFENPTSKSIFSETYLMVESEVFFEPYHRVLKVLQESKIDDLPMKRYIVDVQPHTQPPSYLSYDTIYTISHKNEEIPFTVLNTDKWPDSVFGLDRSQMEAYKFALTRQFAVIQGPPGTGKTYIGIKIAKTILKNVSLEGTPMLIICYTNRALDQFLEGILQVTKNIVRLGSQSKSSALEHYTLSNLRTKVKSKFSHLFAKKRTELETIFKQMMEVQSEIEKCEKEIISYRTLKPYLKVGEKNFDLKSSKEDKVLGWLFAHCERDSEYEDGDKEVEEVQEDLNELSVDHIETCFSDESGYKEIESLLRSIIYVKDITDDEEHRDKMTEKLESQINRTRRRLNCYKKYRTLQNENKLDIEIDEGKDLYSLSPEQRWRVYFNAVGAIRDELNMKMNDLLEQHHTTNKELDEVATSIDGDIIRTVRVVGVTTTVAARRHDLMKTLQSPIVIVEEAAEVLEAHIVSSLTYHCQHVILIGDHKQLRPTAANYKLAKDYNLEISLFERMIRNGIHARTLTTQRRMRPNFVNLLVPAIYDKLISHFSVNSYDHIRGMKDNLYFYSHDVLEDSEGLEDSWSHKNTAEALWCIELANYLRQMNYKPSEITILATYTGQVSLIKELCKKYATLRHVLITVVDNYQGEENRIIILSLVRSNREHKIGFLSAPNRICVALSRAKEGFYIFGNMNVLKYESIIWQCIYKKLTEQNAIGTKLVLRCETHRESFLDIRKVEDFESCLSEVSGSCLKNCKNKIKLPD